MADIKPSDIGEETTYTIKCPACGEYCDFQEEPMQGVDEECEHCEETLKIVY